MSEWETFCDRSYYDLWRVRRKNERGFNDGYHIHNGDEARALVELLNGLERERDEVRSDLEFRRDLFQLQEKQLNEVRVERDTLQEQLDAAIMLGKMQERRHERELEQVLEQYRLSSVCRKLLEENKQLKGES